MTDKELYEAAQEIKKFCESREDGCYMCIFRDNNFNECILTASECCAPEDWEFE